MDAAPLLTPPIQPHHAGAGPLSRPGLVSVSSDSPRKKQRYSQADDVHSLIPGGDNNEALADEVMKIEDASLDALVPSTNTSDPPQNSSATSLSLSRSPIPTMVTFQDETPSQTNTSWSSQPSLEETLSRRNHSSRSISSSSMGEFVLVPGVDFWYIYQWKFWRSD